MTLDPWPKKKMEKEKCMKVLIWQRRLCMKDCKETFKL